jgi:hypothetical protein
MILLFLYIILSIHTVLSTVLMFDLIQISQRPNKLQWALLLALIPIISAILYSRSKKRHKLHNG